MHCVPKGAKTSGPNMGCKKGNANGHKGGLVHHSVHFPASHSGGLKHEKPGGPNMGSEGMVSASPSAPEPEESNARNR